MIEGEVVTFDSYAIYRGGDSVNLAPYIENIPTAIDIYTDNDGSALSINIITGLQEYLQIPALHQGQKKPVLVPTCIHFPIWMITN